jgi:signal transduction histidine kinase
MSASTSRPARWVQRPAVQDAALAATFFALDLLGFWDRRVLDGGALPPVIIVLYGAVGYTALLWRRRAPVIVFGALWLHSLVALQLPGYHPTLGVLVALYTVAAYRADAAAYAALALVFVPAAFNVAEEVQVAPAAQRDQILVASSAVYLVLVFGVWAIGRWIAASRRKVLDLDQRRLAEARGAVDAERVRIARELHDIVAHSVTIMVLQAAGAERMLRRDPDLAGRALATVREVGTEAMSELRRMLTVLRADDDSADDVGRQPRLADIDETLARVRRAGVEVTLDVRGTPARLDPSVDLAAFRVVQEALTNVTKHAGRGAAAFVTLTWGSGLRVQVTDDGRGRPDSQLRSLSTGHGLLGLRERVAVIGGVLEAGPAPAGGFLVSAALPVPAADAGRAPGTSVVSP